MKVKLAKYNNKKSTNVSNSVNIGFQRKTRLLPLENNTATLNLLDLYNEERNKCGKIRFTCTINPICTNVLFNNITEIVRGEGDEHLDILNYSKTIVDEVKDLVYDQTKTKVESCTPYDAVRNTEFSREDIGYEYFCGLDIFNNHLLRSLTFKTVCIDNTSNPNFNTIEDMMRDEEGELIKGYQDDINYNPPEPNVDLHLYQIMDINDFKTTVSEQLIEQNGWLGFTNRGKMLTYQDFDNSVALDVSRVINSKKACEFIEMYPTKDLFSFNPKYNSKRNRLEKNWNYCLTYPSESTTENISFIHNTTKGLKAIYFDENVKGYNGIDNTVIYSVSKHGLVEGDSINLYRNDELLIRNGKVGAIQDDYIFTLYKNGMVISNQWVEIDYDDTEKIYTSSDGRTFKMNTAQRLLIDQASNQSFPIVNGRCNVDLNAQDISYKKVVGGIECQYYVRIFSRLPNFRFADTEITQETLYGDSVNETNDLIAKYRKLPYEFENTLGKAAFAKNAYGDDISQIIFTDDINFDVLVDNLGRPLSEIYLTIIKNNRGYKEWYAKNDSTLNGKTLLDNIRKIIIEARQVEEKKDNPLTKELVADIEYSHAFGKVNCAFKLSDESIVSDMIYPNITTLNNVDNKKGLKIPESFRDETEMLAEMKGVDNDEVDYYRDVKFYGDLCVFTPTEFDETVLQPIMHRFNTAQRELTALDGTYETFRQLKYDNVLSDDYDTNGFQCKQETFNNVCKRKEGYYYQPHYQIKVRSVSGETSIANPDFFQIKAFKNLSVNGNDFIDITTMNYHNLNINDKFMFYDSIADKYYNGVIDSVITPKRVRCIIKDENGVPIGTSVTPPFRNYKMFKPTEEIPDYALIVKDGTCRYIWRNITTNGLDKRSDDEVYPFTNGALYPHLDINLYVRRQDPNNVTLQYSSNGDSMQSKEYPFDKNGNSVFVDDIDTYYEKDEIEC